MQPTTILKFLLAYGSLETAQMDQHEIKIVCPFHPDTNPSCGINLTRGLFYCFACDTGGDMRKLVTQLEARRGNYIDPLEAMLIAEGLKDVRTCNANNIYININIISNISLSGQTEITQEEKRAQRKKAYRFYQSLPRVDWFNLTDNYMLQRGYLPEILNNHSVRINRTSHNPIVIPLLEGKIFKGYVARRIDGIKKRKYQNSTGLDKTGILVGNLTPHLPILVVEGMADKMAACQLGWANTTALLGWKVSEYQLEKLAGLTSCILWATDNDASGREGYEYARSAFKKRHPHVTVSRFAFPEGVKDLGEMLPYPRDFRKILRSSRQTGIVEF